MDDLIVSRQAPPKRADYCDGGTEQHLPEGAVMLAFAMHLLRTIKDLNSVTVHPDGEHGKQFDFRRWLELRSFLMTKSKGSTSYGGTYISSAGKTVIVDPSSGRGDVFAEVNGVTYVAECKGGIINTSHPGQRSRLYRGLCEAIGLLLATPLDQCHNQFAVVPHTPVTENLAKRLCPRATDAVIVIALVDGRGRVSNVI